MSENYRITVQDHMGYISPKIKNPQGKMRKLIQTREEVACSVSFVNTDNVTIRGRNARRDFDNSCNAAPELPSDLRLVANNCARTGAYNPTNLEHQWPQLVAVHGFEHAVTCFKTAALNNIYPLFLDTSADALAKIRPLYPAEYFLYSIYQLLPSPVTLDQRWALHLERVSLWGALTDNHTFQLEIINELLRRLLGYIGNISASEQQDIADKLTSLARQPQESLISLEILLTDILQTSMLQAIDETRARISADTLGPKMTRGQMIRLSTREGGKKKYRTDNILVKQLGIRAVVDAFMEDFDLDAPAEEQREIIAAAETAAKQYKATMKEVAASRSDAAIPFAKNRTNGQGFSLKLSAAPVTSDAPTSNLAAAFAKGKKS